MLRIEMWGFSRVQLIALAIILVHYSTLNHWRGMGILPVNDLCGMGILRGTGILPVSIYSPAGRMPTLLIQRFSNATDSTTSGKTTTNEVNITKGFNPQTSATIEWIIRIIDNLTWTKDFHFVAVDIATTAFY